MKLLIVIIALLCTSCITSHRCAAYASIDNNKEEGF